LTLVSADPAFDAYGVTYSGKDRPPMATVFLRLLATTTSRRPRLVVERLRDGEPSPDVFAAIRFVPPGAGSPFAWSPS